METLELAMQIYRAKLATGKYNHYDEHDKTQLLADCFAQAEAELKLSR